MKFEVGSIKNGYLLGVFYKKPECLDYHTVSVCFIFWYVAIYWGFKCKR